MSHALAEGPREIEDVRVVKVPFHLPPQIHVAPGHESVALDAAEVSNDPYLPLQRVSNRSLSTDNILPPTESSHSRSKSTPLMLDTYISTTPAISPTLSTFTGKSPSTSTFKIPRVSVPAYLTDDGTNREEALGEAIERQMSRSSSMNHSKRNSIGAATFVSVDEGPFG